MKKCRWVAIAVFSIILSLTITLTACSNEIYRKRMLDYYSVDSNYVKLTGVVLEKVKIRNEFTNTLSIKITSSDDDFYLYGTDTGDFHLYFDEELLDNIFEGDTIIFESAPRIFYDGQKYPIISLYKDGQELLSFAEGKSSYIEWIKNDF